MTQMIYTDQSAKDLRLNLVRGPVDKKLLAVLCTGEVELPYGKVDAGIIGASHYLEFSNPDGSVVFTEVFACTDLDVEGREYYGDLNDSSSITKHFGNLTYDFSVRNLNMEKGEDAFIELMGKINQNFSNLQIGLQYLFPVQDTEGDFPPLTLVHVKADPEKPSVEVDTLHAYPNEGSLVFTKTHVQSRME